jgi:hypothetical protein
MNTPRNTSSEREAASDFARDSRSEFEDPDDQPQFGGLDFEGDCFGDEDDEWAADEIVAGMLGRPQN